MKKELFAKRTPALAMAAPMAAGAPTGCSSGSKETAAAGDTTAAPATGSGAVGSEAAGSEAVGSSGEAVIARSRYWVGNTDHSVLMQDIVRKFNAENGKGTTVVGEETPWDGSTYSENLFNTKTGGGDTNCITRKLTPAPLFVNNDPLVDLTSLVDGQDKKDDVDENIYSIIKEARSTDRLYAISWSTRVLHAHHRPSVLKTIGVEVPEIYEELLAVIEKYIMGTNGDGKANVYGFGMRDAKGGQEPWGSFVHGHDGSFEDMITPEVARGTQDFINAYTESHAPPITISGGFNEITANFKSDLIAVTIHHIGSPADIKVAFGDDVSALPFPAGKGQWASMGDTETVIFESCQSREAAFEWVAYLTTGKGQKMWCESIGNVSVGKTVQTGSFFRSN